MVQPDYISFGDWVGTVIQDYPSVLVPYITDESEWRAFGVVLISQDTFAAISPPDPFAFGDWREWARALWSVAPVPGS